MRYDHIDIQDCRREGLSWVEIARDYYPGADPNNIRKAHSRWRRRLEDADHVGTLVDSLEDLV